MRTADEGRLREFPTAVIAADEGRLRAEDGRGMPAGIGMARSEME